MDNNTRPDLSQLIPPLPTNTQGVRRLLSAYRSGTAEVCVTYTNKIFICHTQQRLNLCSRFFADPNTLNHSLFRFKACSAKNAMLSLNAKFARTCFGACPILFLTSEHTASDQPHRWKRFYTTTSCLNTIRTLRPLRYSSTGLDQKKYLIL